MLVCMTVRVNYYSGYSIIIVITVCDGASDKGKNMTYIRKIQQQMTYIRKIQQQMTSANIKINIMSLDIQDK